MKYYDKSIVEEEFKKRRAKITFEHQYFNRGSYSAYFTQRDRSSQAIVKFVHHHGKVQDLIKYVADEKRTGSESNVFSADGQALSKDDLKTIESFWHNRNKGDDKQNARHSTHIILSTKESPTPENVWKLKEVVSSLSRFHFTVNGYDSFFTIHTNKAHLHAHLVVHNRNLITGKKIKFSKFANIYSLRKDFSDLLNQKGWNYSCTLNKDSMEVRDGLNSQMKHQNYVLSQVEKSLGETARKWTKKQFINKFSDSEQKAEEAKRNLALIRKLDDPEAYAEVISKIKEYESKKQKWDIKKQLHSQYPALAVKSINAYVDSVFATQDQLARSFTTKNKKSVDTYQSVSDLADNLTKKDVSGKIVDFQKFIDRKQQRDREVKRFDLYGEIGRQYMRQLHCNLDFAKTDTQRSIVSDKIDDLKKGMVDQTEFDFFRQSLLEENSKPYRQFYKQRIHAFKKAVAEKANVNLKEVTEMERLFKLYCSRRGSDSVYAYRQFKSGIDRYAEVLKSGNGERIWHFSNNISQKIGDSAEQNQRLDKNAKVPGMGF